MRQWLEDKRLPYLERILQMKGVPSATGGICLCDCGLGRGIWRCMDCADRSGICILCCRNRHKLHWFHRVEKWNGRFFQRGALWQVGVKIFVGHKGAPCPRSISGLSEFDFKLGVAPSSRHVRTVIGDVAERVGQTKEEVLGTVSDILDRAFGVMSEMETSILEEIGKETGETSCEVLQRLKAVASRRAEDDADAMQAFADRTSAQAENVHLEGNAPVLDSSLADDDWEDEDDRAKEGNISRFLPRPPPTDGAGNIFLTVVHSNGFHSLPVVWCNCAVDQNDRDLQLLDL